MAVIHRLFERLRGTADESVDLALAAALATSDAAAAKLIALLLLERRHPVAMRALVAHFDRLPDAVQSTIVRHANELYRALREAASDDDPQAATQAMRIIRRSGSTRLAYLVTEQLRHGPAELRDEAAACLLEMARALAAAAATGGPGCDGVSANYLLAAIEEAVVHYRVHERPDTLTALAVLAPRPTPAADKALADWQHAALEPLRAALASGADADFRRALLPFAARASLSDAAQAGMQQAIASRRIEEVLEHWHLLHVPAVRRVTLKLSATDHGYLTDHAAANWSPMRSRGLPAWIDALPLALPLRLEALGQLAEHGDRDTRLGGLRLLIEMFDAMSRPNALAMRSSSDASAAAIAAKGPGAAINAAIEGYVNDAEPAIARIALRHLVRCKWPALPKLLLRLVNGPQEEIRRLAGDYLAPLGFDRYWQSWPRLDGPQRIAAGRALIKLDPCFHRHLSQRLAGGDRDDCLRALAMIGDLNQGAFFEKAILALARSDDAHVAAAAVTALASASSAEATAALEKALENRDSRVRANAIEALQQLRSHRHLDRLTAMALSEENRPRANAIGHLLELSSGQALQALRMMLEDERPMHRISALWLVDAAGLIEVVRHVAELSITDTDPEVRHRAAKVIERLMAAMQTQSVAADGRME